MENEKQTKQCERIPDLYEQLIDLEPKLVTYFTPEKQNSLEQKELFLAGKIRNPHHIYDKLDEVNFSDSIAKVNQVGLSLLSNESLNPKHRFAYEDAIDFINVKSRLGELAYLYNHADNTAEKNNLAQDYLELDAEAYGRPDELTYRSLLNEKLNRINKSKYNDDAIKIRDELFQMVGYEPNERTIDRFSPADETVEWTKAAIDFFYGGMLSHIPEKEKFSPEDIQSIFEEIIKDEFGEAADGWRVELDDSASIKVVTQDRRIVIPNDRKEADFQGVKQLVVHELGVHFFRYIMGADTDAMPLKSGWGSSYDSEEGLALVMEQAIKGKYGEGGVEPYISIGLTYFDKKDFRDAFEVKWRLSALHEAKKTGEITEEIKDKAKEKAYASVSRCLRGTDELPFFKDLAYYNGVTEIWKYLEKTRGDDLELTILFAGKVNPCDAKHRRLVLESATV